MTPTLDEPWQEFARFLILDAIAQRGLTYRQLSELLSAKGVEVTPKTLSRRINRGTFDAGFFLMCLDALGATRIDFEAEMLGDVVLKPRKHWEPLRPKG